MLGLWTLLVVRGEVPELTEGRPSIRFHLAAEVLTAVALLAAGIGLATDASWAPLVASGALGMALYSCVASPGYYADRGERGPVVMFTVLAAVVAVAIGVLVIGT